MGARRRLSTPARLGDVSPTIEVLMRRTAHAGVLPCALVALLSSCSSDAPTAADAPTSSAAPLLATAGGSCGTPRRPGGVVEKVNVPSAWGVAVRDDGLTYFTQPYDGGVGITSTQSRT